MLFAFVLTSIQVNGNSNPLSSRFGSIFIHTYGCRLHANPVQHTLILKWAFTLFLFVTYLVVDNIVVLIGNCWKLKDIILEVFNRLGAQ